MICKNCVELWILLYEIARTFRGYIFLGQTENLSTVQPRMLTQINSVTLIFLRNTYLFPSSIEHVKYTIQQKINIKWRADDSVISLVSAKEKRQ